MIIEVADVMLVKAERTKESLPAASLLRKAGLGEYLKCSQKIQV